MNYRRHLRFIASGTIAAITYCVFMTKLAQHGHQPLTAGAIAYLASMPVAFFLHRLFTFRSSASVTQEVSKFILTSLIGVAVASITPHLMMKILDSPAWLASITASILTPVISYLLMSSWVFYVETHD